MEIPTATLKFEIHDLPGPLPAWLELDGSAVTTTGVLTLKTDFKSVSDLLKPDASQWIVSAAGVLQGGRRRNSSATFQNATRAFRVIGGHVTYGPTEANAICSQWAVKDLDCPISGCLGFQFTLPRPPSWPTPHLMRPRPHRPKPQVFPANEIQFTRTATVPDNEKPKDLEKITIPLASTQACRWPRMPSSPKTCLVP